MKANIGVSDVPAVCIITENSLSISAADPTARPNPLTLLEKTYRWAVQSEGDELEELDIC